MIETLFVILTSVMILVFVLDLGGAFIYQGRLEQVDYSAATTLRERNALYSSSETVTQSEVDEIREMAAELMEETDLVVRVDTLTFTTDSTKTVNAETTFYSPQSSECKTTLPSLSNYASLSPWSLKERWMPLYRITLCMPGKTSLFLHFVSEDSDTLVLEEFLATSIVLPR